MLPDPVRLQDRPRRLGGQEKRFSFLARRLASSGRRNRDSRVMGSGQAPVQRDSAWKEIGSVVDLGVAFAKCVLRRITEDGLAEVQSGKLVYPTADWKNHLLWRKNGWVEAKEYFQTHIRSEQM